MAAIIRLSNQAFVTGFYYVAENGDIVAEMPERCPRAGVDGTCKIKKFGVRERFCGIGYPLWIFVCLTHHCHFTLYPPGWFPYARNPIVPLTPDGKPIEIVCTGAECERLVLPMRPQNFFPRFKLA
jgi:hypothetical protein